MKIGIGCDHAAFDIKECFRKRLIEDGYEVEDFGTDSAESVDYPDIARPLAEAVAKGRLDQGILLCGTGLGMCYVANRTPGIRASLCWSKETALLARDHNDANVLVLPGRADTIDALDEILQVWLQTPFSGNDRHGRRIGKIEGL